MRKKMEENEKKRKNFKKKLAKPIIGCILESVLKSSFLLITFGFEAVSIL